MKSETLSNVRKIQLAYWRSLVDTLKEMNEIIPPKPKSQHYLSIRIGKSNAKICATMCLRKKIYRR